MSFGVGSLPATKSAASCGVIKDLTIVERVSQAGEHTHTEKSSKQRVAKWEAGGEQRGSRQEGGGGVLVQTAPGYPEI